MLVEKKCKNWKILAACIFSLALAACASVDKGTARSGIGSAQEAIGQAEKANAREYAALELTTAEEQLAGANHALEQGDYVKADRLADQAAVNAQLAEAKAETSRTKGMVKSLEDSINDLRQDIDLNTKGQ